VSKMALKYGLLDLANLLIWNWTLSKVFFSKNCVWTYQMSSSGGLNLQKDDGSCDFRCQILRQPYEDFHHMGLPQIIKHWTISVLNPHIWVLSQLVRRNSSVDHVFRRGSKPHFSGHEN
jgi:hypothetical protein